MRTNSPAAAVKSAAAWILWRPVHVLSYAGSHSAYTLARLLPDTEIVSHGKYYRGGGYQRLMVQRLRRLPNVIQRNGPLFTTLLHPPQRHLSAAGRRPQAG